MLSSTVISALQTTHALGSKGLKERSVPGIEMVIILAEVSLAVLPFKCCPNLVGGGRPVVAATMLRHPAKK